MELKLTSRFSTTTVRIVQDSYSVLNITRQEIAYINNLHENVKEPDIYEFFDLKTTTYLRDNCSVHMPQLESNGRRKRYIYINPPAHVFNEIVKLNRVAFHGNKLFLEEAKMLLGIIYSINTSIKSSNLLETFWNIHPPKLANPTRSNPGQPLKQNIKK